MDLALQLIDMLVHVDKYLGTVIDQYGYWVYAILFLIVFAETGLVVRRSCRATRCCLSRVPSAQPAP